MVNPNDKEMAKILKQSVDDALAPPKPLKRISGPGRHTSNKSAFEGNA